MVISGIYTITCLINNKIYVGKTNNIYTREDDHFQSLRNNTHHNYHLQKAFNKYGEDNFVYEILIECDENILYSEEHYWCNMLNAHNRKFGYNIRPTHPEGRCGVSENTKILIANAFKKPIIVLSKDGIFIDKCESLEETCKKFNVGSSTVSKSINNKSKTYEKFVFVLEKDYDRSKDYKIIPKIKIYNRYTRTILMYDLNNVLLREFVSMTDAAKYINSEIYTLWRILNKRKGRKTEPKYEFKGYIWKYKQK